MAKTKTAAVEARPRRARLSRERVLEEALRLVDEEGLQALTMRALGKRLGVDPMAVYNHVPGKAALRQGIGELLWAELARSTVVDEDWRGSMRAFAAAVRRLAREHPNAYPLLLTGTVSPAPGLRLFAAQLDVLQAAGCDESRAAEILRAVFGYAYGYATIELSSLCLDCGSADDPADFEAILALSRTLPPDLPTELAQVARVVCLATDLDTQFEFGLDALLRGFET
jgi:TetR/AcrR family transcriptional regulator, tetracycline repressor protein